jgi:hypothetical protein
VVDCWCGVVVHVCGCRESAFKREYEKSRNRLQAGDKPQATLDNYFSNRCVCVCVHATSRLCLRAPVLVCTTCEGLLLTTDAAL